MLPSITSILVNADPNTQLGAQPRHPKSGTYQGMPHTSARKGFAQEQSPEVADSSKGKGDDAPNDPAEEIEDEGDMIGQGDRPQKPRVTGGVREGAPQNNSRRDANKERRDEDDDEDDEDDDETFNVDTTGGGAAESLHRAGEAGQVKYESAKPSLGRAVGRVASSVIHPIQTVHGQGSLLLHHPGVAISAAAKSIVHPIKHSVDAGIGKPEEHKATPMEAAQTRGHFGGEPMFADTPHDQTLRAAGASLAHPASREHAMGAMDASMAGDSKGAAKLHKKSAREHLKEAEAHMKDGNSEQADAHLQAAMMHHKAATCHSGMAMNRDTSHDPHSGRFASIGRHIGAAAGTVLGGTAGALGGAAATETPVGLGAGAVGGAVGGAYLGSKIGQGVGHLGDKVVSGVKSLFHRGVAKAHDNASKMARKQGDHKLADAHEALRDKHKAKASSMTGNQSMSINRKNVIDFIVVNCDCGPTGGPEATRNALKQKSNEELLGLKSKLLGLINANAKAEGSFADTKGGGGKGMMAGGTGYGADDEVTYKEDEDDDLDNGEGETAEDAFTGKGTTRNNQATANQRSGPMTREEWMAAAPPEIREVVSNAEANDNREKLDLHRRITFIANSQHPQRKALILNELQGIKTKKGLQRLLGLVLPTESITDNEEAALVFRGAGAPEANIIDNQGGGDLLVPPTINWADEYADALHGKSRQTSTSSSGR